jgi:phospholipase D-like protein
MVAPGDPSTASGLSPGVVLVLVVILVAVDLWVAIRLIKDLYQPERRAYGDKDTWAIIILFGSVLGMLAYIYIGRVE